jgi:hypothetical protein
LTAPRQPWGRGREEVRWFADDLSVRACNVELVRNEFYKQYPADGTEQQKASTRRQAFNRALKHAQARSLIACREVVSVTLIARDVGSSHRDRGARSTEGGQAVDVR